MNNRPIRILAICAALAAPVLLAACGDSDPAPATSDQVTTSTTEAMSGALNGIDWRAGDNVVVPANDFPGVVYPCLHLQRRGVTVILTTHNMDEAERIADEDVEINQRMGRFGAEIVPGGANILHHCNTGSLATVDYGTALGVVRAAHEAGKNIHVWVDETRPRLQGARLTAWELMRDGIPMHLIADTVDSEQ